MSGASVLCAEWSSHECRSFSLRPGELPQPGGTGVQGSPGRHLQVHPRGKGEGIDKDNVFYLIAREVKVTVLNVTSLPVSSSSSR